MFKIGKSETRIKNTAALAKQAGRCLPCKAHPAPDRARLTSATAAFKGPPMLRSLPPLVALALALVA